MPFVSMASYAILVVTEPMIPVATVPAMDFTVREQFDELIFQPLGTLFFSETTPIAIIVDALDECDREEQIKPVIQLLSELKALEPWRVKVSLTRRSELPPHHGF